ncbi:MAG: M28 family peptidase, partial [Candidatus Coatesbacteria bacterium]
VLVEYEGREQAYDLLDNGWAVVEAHPSFCLILCPEEQAGAVPGGRIIADGSETLYVIWNPGNRPLPEIEGIRIIEVPGKAQILVARAADAMEYAAAGAELKLVNKTPIRKPLERPPLRTVGDIDPVSDELIHEMLGKITPERYEEIVETLSIGVTPTRYTPSIYFDPATDYVQTTFHEIPNMDVQVWHYEGEANPSEMHWSGKNHGWISTDGYVWRTDDGGANWATYECNGSANGVVFTNVNTGFLCGSSGFIAKTKDGGLTWTETDVTDHEIDFYSMSFVDPFNGITAGSDGIYYITNDGGYTWESDQIKADEDIFSVFFTDAETIWATADYRKIYRSVDGGETWDDLSGNLPLGTFNKIWFHDAVTGIIAGFSGIYYTEDGGITWEEAVSEFGEFLFDIFFIDDNVGWVGGENGFVYRTDDGGKSWTTHIASSENIGSIFFVSADEGWIVDYLANIYYTDDGGYTWELTDPEFIYPTWENVIAEIEGSVNPDEVIIICGHYDSISEDPYHFAPGAEDNASGSGGVIASAEAMAGYEYESTVRFIAFSGEEEGLVGSTAYAEAMAEKGENIVGVINMDMVAYLDEPVYDIKVKHNEPSTDLLEAIIDAGAVYTPSLEICPELYEPRASDHMPFWQNGYRAVEIIEQDNDHFHPWYHSTEDLPEHLDFTYGAEVVRLAAATAATLAGITGRRPDDGEEDIIAYPNPARPSDAGITFTNLPDNVTLTLYNVAGERVFERSGVIGDETLWTRINDRGNPVASGVYIYRITDVDGNHTTGKVAVIR